MGRSILAIATGFVLIFVLAMGTNLLLGAVAPDMVVASGTTNPAALVLSLAYVAVYAIAGCYLAARLAPLHPMRHALILGVLGLAFNLVGAVTMWDQVPAWYNLAGPALAMPYAWIGGRIRERELSRTGALAPAS